MTCRLSELVPGRCLADTSTSWPERSRPCAASRWFVAAGQSAAGRQLAHETAADPDEAKIDRWGQQARPQARKSLRKVESADRLRPCTSCSPSAFPPATVPRSRLDRIVKHVSEIGGGRTGVATTCSQAVRRRQACGLTSLVKVGRYIGSKVGQALESNCSERRPGSVNAGIRRQGMIA